MIQYATPGPRLQAHNDKFNVFPRPYSSRLPVNPQSAVLWSLLPAGGSLDPPRSLRTISPACIPICGSEQKNWPGFMKSRRLFWPRKLQIWLQ